MNSVIKDNKSYCPFCSEHDYRIAEYKQVKKGTQMSCICRKGGNAMDIKTIIDWLESIYQEHGNISVKLNNMSMENIDLEDMFQLVDGYNSKVSPCLNIYGIQDYRE